MTETAEPKAIPPKGSAWAAVLAEPKRTAGVWTEPQPENPQTIQVVVLKPEQSKP